MKRGLLLLMALSFFLITLSGDSTLGVFLFSILLFYLSILTENLTLLDNSLSETLKAYEKKGQGGRGSTFYKLKRLQDFLKLLSPKKEDKEGASSLSPEIKKAFKAPGKINVGEVLLNYSQKRLKSSFQASNVTHVKFLSSGSLELSSIGEETEYLSLFLEAKKHMISGLEGREIIHFDFSIESPLTLSPKEKGFGEMYLLRIREDETSFLCFFYKDKTPPFSFETERMLEFASYFGAFLTEAKNFFEYQTSLKKEKTISKEKDKYISHVSHDIRSPLNNIKQILFLFKEHGLKGNEELLESALSNADELQHIVSDILDFSSSQAGCLKVRKELFEVEPELLSLKKAYNVKAKRKGLTLSLKTSTEGSFISADRGHFRRILSNLISNAIKYTDSGSVSLSVEETGDSYQIIVADTGTGMTAKEKTQLFTPFTRFSENNEGIGLGLVVTKIHLEKNGGQIHVNSTKGEGTEMLLSFPKGEVRFKKKREKPFLKLPLKASVLVVDDDPDSVQTLSKVLSHFGLEVFKATSVKEAKELSNFISPEFLITDFDMPEGGGRELIKHFYKNKPASTVFVLSGNTRPDEIRNLSGVSEVFLKPCNIEDLLEKIRIYQAKRAA